MKKFWKNYNLSIVLFLLFFFSLIGQAIFQWQEFVQNQTQHNQPPQIVEFLPEFASRMFENWQSEFLQLFTMVVLTAYLVHKGSHESKDTDEEFSRRLANIESYIKPKGTAKSRRG